MASVHKSTWRKCSCFCHFWEIMIYKTTAQRGRWMFSFMLVTALWLKSRNGLLINCERLFFNASRPNRPESVARARASGAFSRTKLRWRNIRSELYTYSKSSSSGTASDFSAWNPYIFCWNKLTCRYGDHGCLVTADAAQKSGASRFQCFFSCDISTVP